MGHVRGYERRGVGVGYASLRFEGSIGAGRIPVLRAGNDWNERGKES
jgi:hypothetical protein